MSSLSSFPDLPAYFLPFMYFSSCHEANLQWQNIIGYVAFHWNMADLSGDIHSRKMIFPPLANKNYIN